MIVLNQKLLFGFLKQERSITFRRDLFFLTKTTYLFQSEDIYSGKTNNFLCVEKTNRMLSETSPYKKNLFVSLTFISMLFIHLSDLRTATH